MVFGLCPYWVKWASFGHALA